MSKESQGIPGNLEESCGPSHLRTCGRERTFLMIKPDGVKRKLIGVVIDRLEKESFEIVALKMTRLSVEEAMSLYRTHKGKAFYSPLIDFITSGPVIALVLERNDGLRYLRRIVGATNPAQAQKETLRRNLGTDVQRNVIHAAETKEDAEREIVLLFGEPQ